MTRGLRSATAALALGLAASAAGAGETPPRGFLEMACMTPVQQARLIEGTLSTVVAVTAERGYVYQLLEAEGRWMLVVRRSESEACIVAQGTEIHYHPAR